MRTSAMPTAESRVAKTASPLAALVVLATTIVPGGVGDPAVAAATETGAPSATLIDRRDGFVDAGGVMIYYESIGTGQPLLVLHGGPGLAHDYFLPYFLRLAAQRRLVFIDERGCGRSEHLIDPKGYTLDGMVSDVEAVRVALGLGKIDLLGHSFGGILAQAYAVKHPGALRRLILASTGSSAARIDADFAKLKGGLDKSLRDRIEALEARGILDDGGAQLPEYRKLADEAELPYEYHGRPPSWDSAGGPTGWDVLKEMWGARSDFHIDGNLEGFDFTPALHRLTVPTLVIYGDHDLLGPATAEQTHAAIGNSQLVELRNSGHMTFVDQPAAFFTAVSAFLK
jgi:proline iminopeptidase